MNPTPNQITECDDEKQLCEWLGYALGWKIVDIKGKPHWDKGYEITPKSKWQPTSPTEKGKAQCFDLISKFDMGIVRLPASKSWAVSWDKYDGEGQTNVIDKNLQVAVVKAALLCAMGD